MPRSAHVLFGAGLIVGAVAGVGATLRVLKVEVDLPGVPYRGEGVTVEHDLKLRQGKTEVVVPAGAEVRLDYITGEGIEFYSLRFQHYGDPIAARGLGRKAAVFIAGAAPEGVE